VSPHPDWTDQTIRALALRVRYFLRKKFPDLDQATIDDLAQEVMQAAYIAAQQQRFEARHGARFETYVLQIARHKAADFLRQRRRRREPIAPLDFIAEESGDVENDVAQSDLLEKVKQAVELLNERHAWILRLHFYQGLKVKEIAQQLDISEQEVSNLKSYALRKVREFLETN
jgi:RNA polymerase sigma-70 factor (ECF subfamily)